MSPATTPMETTERASGRGTTRERKDAAVAFLRAAASGGAREAFAKHVARGFRHHNPFFPGDGDALAKGMDDNAAQFPDKVLEAKHVLADGDLVAVHSLVHLRPGDAGIATVHIFRFEGDRVVELWDVGQEIPADSPNENGAF